MTCERCQRTDALCMTMSRFNTQMICDECEDIEKAHPRYEEARKAEEDAVRSGNMNFPGIGLPLNLYPAHRREQAQGEEEPT